MPNRLLISWASAGIFYPIFIFASTFSNSCALRFSVIVSPPEASLAFHPCGANSPLHCSVAVALKPQSTPNPLKEGDEIRHAGPKLARFRLLLSLPSCDRRRIPLVMRDYGFSERTHSNEARQFAVKIVFPLRAIR